MMAQFRISARLLLTAGAALAVLAAAVLTGWLSIERVGGRTAGGGDARALSAAFGVARHAGLMVSADSVRTNSRMTADSLTGISASVEKSKAALNEQLKILEAEAPAERAARVRRHVESLVANTESTESRRPELLRLMKAGEAALRDFRYGFSKDLEVAMITSMDDQIHHMMTGYDEAGQPTETATGPISREILRLYHFANLMSTRGVAVIKLRGAAVLPYPHMIPYIREDFESATQRIEDSLRYLTENGAPNLHPQAIPLLKRLVSFGAGEGEANIWDRTIVKLRLRAAEARQIAANEKILEQLFGEVDRLVADVRQRAAAANAASVRAADDARTILLIVAAIGLLGTLLAVWFFGARARET